MEVTFYETTAFTEGVSKLKAEDQCLELKEELARNLRKATCYEARAASVRSGCVCPVEARAEVPE